MWLQETIPILVIKAGKKTVTDNKMTEKGFSSLFLFKKVWEITNFEKIGVLYVCVSYFVACTFENRLVSHLVLRVDVPVYLL